MKFKLNINGKESEIDAPANIRLSILIRDILGRKSVKHTCGCGKCGFCLVILDDIAVYSCMYPAIKAQNKNILTLEGISQKSEYNNIIKGFDLANVSLCPNCAPSRILLIYNQLEKNRELTQPLFDNIIESVTCDCTSTKELKEAIYLAANFFQGAHS